MATTKNVIKGRILNKADTEENWNKALTFVPLKGEICVYLPDEMNMDTRFKVGDGETTISNLPFAIPDLTAITEAEIDAICGASIVPASEVLF